MSDEHGEPVHGDAGAAPGEEKAAEHSFLTATRLERYRERLFDTALLGLPLAAINWGLGRITRPLTEEPWHALWFLAPLAVAAWILWRQVMRRGSLRVRGALLAFLICYLSVFTVAGASRLLVWKHDTVAVDEGQLPRDWVLPAGWGDWRYRFARRDLSNGEPVVMTMPAATGSTDRDRFELANLIKLAADNGARGVAFDFYLGRESSNLDAFLCQVVRSAGIPVIAGLHVVRGASTHILYAEEYPDSIAACFPSEHRGHLLAYRDGDGTVRNVVLRLGIPDSVSLALRVASQIAAGQGFPPDRVLQYVEPKEPFLQLAYQQLSTLPREELNGALRGHFLLVGEDSPKETFHTPFGDRLGVQIHAAAIASLLAGRWIQRPPWWSGMLVILVACYLITALVSDGASGRRLVLVTLGISTFLLASAALAMRLWLVWLDVIYPILAVWLLLGLLLSLRRKLARRTS